MSPNTPLLIIDDDTELCALLAEFLEREGFQTTLEHDGLRGLELALNGAFALIVLDLMLPSLDGFALLKLLRVKSRVPVLMLTARGEDVDRIVGLELGADDYLPKPFNPRELVARIRAILRRAGSRAARGAATDVVEVGPIKLNMGNHQVRIAGENVVLTGAELRVLELLMRSAGQVISRDSLTEQALGRRLAAYDRSIDTHISNLRRKLNLLSGKDPEIKNIRGSGYILTNGQ